MARWRRILLTNAAAWGGAILLEAGARYTDGLRRGAAEHDFVLMVGQGLATWWPWVLFTAVAYGALSRAEAWRPRGARARWALAVAVLGFFVLQVGYQVALAQWRAGKPFVEFPASFAAWPAVFWVIDVGILVAAAAVVYAIAAVRAGLADQQRRARVEAENLALRLELEQRKLVALRAQLEPHFLFNSLNAISGLVRGEVAARAVAALNRLSELLRYALIASSRDWVSVADELQFVRSYIELQNLRYEERLRFSIVGETTLTTTADCPPLLLQPLVENAIRHDVELHSGVSDIQLSLEALAADVVVYVTNPLHPTTERNSGFGLGLRSTRDRLRLLYGDRASFEAGERNGRFVVRLQFPADADA